MVLCSTVITVAYMASLRLLQRVTEGAPSPQPETVMWGAGSSHWNSRLKVFVGRVVREGWLQ